MTIADLVAAPNSQQEPFRALVHVEYQLRVLGLLCAAADVAPIKFSTPGSLESWAEYGKKQSEKLGCVECRTDVSTIADSINTVVTEESKLSIRLARNRFCHGGPVPESIDHVVLHKVLADNAERIVRIHEHGHVAELTPYFRRIDGELAALHSFSGTAATYWPRRREARDVTDPDVVDALKKLNFHRGDRLLDDFAQDIERDLKGFAERDSVYVLVSPPEPIAVRWDRRSSDGPVPRVDRFIVGADHARMWVTESGPKPYKAFLADVCNWPLLKRRLLEELEEQVAAEKRISQELFPNLQQSVPHVPTLVEFDDDYQGPQTDLTITAACAEVTEGIHAYRGSTNLITLTGEAGAGKTHSLLQFARESLAADDGLDPVAIYISSSRSSATSLDKLITERVAGTRILDREPVLALCRAGLAILVIDGFDEMLGFRSYDDPLSGLQPILDQLRNRGAVILSARASYSEARLWKSLAEHPAKESHHRLTTMKLQPWRRSQLLELMDHLSVDAAATEETPAVRQLLTTPFFCLAYAAWKQNDPSGDFLRFVVDTYLQRELSKLTDLQGESLFSHDDLSEIFCEVAELTARTVTAEVSESDLVDAAEYALGTELDEKERRRLVALCGMSADWSEHELSFSFTHLAIAEHFLARQVVRVPFQQALALLSDVAVSTLCAQLIASMWPAAREERLNALITALQSRVSAAPSPQECQPAMASLGELWARVHGTAQHTRTVSRIVVDRLELGGSGTVTLDQAQVKYLVVGPGVKVRLTNSRIEQLDLSRTSGNPLLDESYTQVGELFTQGGLASTPRRIKELLGLPEEPVDESAIEAFFREKIANARAPIVVDRHYSPPDEDVRFKWTREHGDKWQAFAKRLVAEGALIEERVNAAGPPKWRLRVAEAFFDQ
ncbi:NACHT domain-containing protein [Kitasatospora purpeofusca]|uniref:NACHT domain-containing protein n=1 Tax=Kitasatospora purpeofusca TaxID=67352 RepID=UPI0035D9509F